MADRTMGSWCIGWKLDRKIMGKKRQLPVTIFYHLVAVRDEFDQYFDDDSVLRVRACCRGAVPEESIACTLEEYVISSIQHVYLDLRCAAMNVLRHLSRRYTRFLGESRIRKQFTTPPAFVLTGNSNVIGAILAVLPSLQFYDLERALDALCVISNKGNVSVIRAIAEMTWHFNRNVRVRAFRALQSIADVGDQVAISAALRCVDDDSDGYGSFPDDEYCLARTDPFRVRLSSLKALKTIAEGTDDVTVLGSVIEQIENHTSQTVRFEALDVLQKVARKGNVDAISACVGCCSPDDDDEVWERALDVLGHLAQRGCKDAISACFTSLAHKNVDVVRAAAKVLGKVGCLPAALVLRSRGEAATLRPL